MFFALTFQKTFVILDFSVLLKIYTIKNFSTLTQILGYIYKLFNFFINFRAHKQFFFKKNPKVLSF